MKYENLRTYPDTKFQLNRHRFSAYIDHRNGENKRANTEEFIQKNSCRARQHFKLKKLPNAASIQGV
jgi:hypothetical protein